MPAILQEVQQGGSGAPRESQQWPCDSAAVEREWGKEGEARWERRRGSENDREKEEISGTQKHIFARTQRKRERVSEYSVTSRER